MNCPECNANDGNFICHQSDHNFAYYGLQNYKLMLSIDNKQYVLDHYFPYSIILSEHDAATFPSSYNGKIIIGWDARSSQLKEITTEQAPVFIRKMIGIKAFL
jgi:hypothetical protein